MKLNPRIMIYLILSCFTLDASEVSFANTSTDLTNEISKCEIEYLKDSKSKNCVIKRFEGHSLILDIYDIPSNGPLIETQQLKITSWHNEAEVYYKDLLKDGKDLIFVQFEGSTGTGTLQKILMIFGWHNGKFIPVLIEPLSYYKEELGHLTELQVKYTIEERENSISVIFNYAFIKETPQGEVKQKWNDKLSWNHERFSFYDPTEEQIKDKNSKYAVQKRILDTRLNLIGKSFDLSDFSIETLRQIKIMEILNDEKYP